MQFHATWATFRAPPPHPDPHVTFVDAPFTTHAVHFHSLGPHLRLAAHKWVVHDLDPDARTGIVVVLSHYIDQDAVTLVGVYAVHVLKYPSWSIVATHCLSSFGDDAAPDGAFADSESRLLKLLAVNRKDQTYALVDWVADAPSRLLIFSFAAQEHEPRVVGQFEFESASQNTPELATRTNGDYLLMYLDPVHDHSVVLQHLSRTLRPLHRHHLRPNTCHFHYDVHFPQYVLTSHTDGRTVLWDTETATAVASMRVSRQHPVELSIFRPWWASPPPAPPAPGAAPFLPPILSVLITTDDWDLHSPHSMYLYTPEPVTAAITDDDEDDDDGARALDEPESVVAKRHLLYHWDAPAFLACMASHHLFFSLDPFGHVRVHDMARDAAASTIASLNLRVHDRFARVTPDHVFRTRMAFMGLQRNGALQYVPDRSLPSMVTKFTFPRTAICSELARPSAAHAATDTDEPPAAPESAPSTTATAMSVDVPTFTIQTGDDEPAAGEAAPNATAAAGNEDGIGAAGPNDAVPPPPLPMGDGTDESLFDPEDEFDPDVLRMLPYGDLMFLGRDATTMLVYRGPLLMVLERHRGGEQ
ncbi:hypothetical protein GGF32_000791 [Allomyces javanicus]|nr:hypothetical protein GGF32_000791 [Allomyces javanicus]